jgi:hypothetical protein
MTFLQRIRRRLRRRHNRAFRATSAGSEPSTSPSRQGARARRAPSAFVRNIVRGFARASHSAAPATRSARCDAQRGHCGSSPRRSALGPSRWSHRVAARLDRDRHLAGRSRIRGGSCGEGEVVRAGADSKRRRGLEPGFFRWCVGGCGGGWWGGGGGAGGGSPRTASSRGSRGSRGPAILGEVVASVTGGPRCGRRSATSTHSSWKLGGSQQEWRGRRRCLRAPRSCRERSRPTMASKRACTRPWPGPGGVERTGRGRLS